MFCFAKYSAHHAYLRLAFGEVRLVDAKGVNPDTARIVSEPERYQFFSQARAYTEFPLTSIVDALNSYSTRRIAPCIR